MTTTPEAPFGEPVTVDPQVAAARADLLRLSAQLAAVQAELQEALGRLDGTTPVPAGDLAWAAPSPAPAPAPVSEPAIAVRSRQPSPIELLLPLLAILLVALAALAWMR